MIASGRSDAAASELRSGEEMADEGEDVSRRNVTTTSTAASVVLSGFDLRRAGEQLEEEGVIWLEYRDFNCSEVLSVWYYITLSFMILSSLGCLLTSSFLVIYGIECQRRHEQEQKYFTVRTNGDHPPAKTSDQRKSEEPATVQDSGGVGDAGERVLSNGDTNVTGSVDVKTTEA